MASVSASGAGSEGGGREAGLAAPLSERLRPESLEGFLGQGHLAERLQGLMSAEALPNLLFFGPPGCGKSTVAMLLARRAGRAWRRVKTPEAGTARLRTRTRARRAGKARWVSFFIGTTSCHMIMM